MNPHDDFYFLNDFVSSSQNLISVLGWLQMEMSNSASGSVYIYDLVGQQTLYTSYPVVEMLGYTVDEIYAMGPIGLANLIHPDDLNRVSEHYQRFATLRSGEVIAIEYRMQQADGNWCCLCSQETALTTAQNGSPLQVLGVLQDITQRASINSENSLLVSLVG